MEKLINRRSTLPIQRQLQEVLSKHNMWRLADQHKKMCQSLQAPYLRDGGFYMAKAELFKRCSTFYLLHHCQSFSATWTDTV